MAEENQTPSQNGVLEITNPHTNVIVRAIDIENSHALITEPFVVNTIDMVSSFEQITDCMAWICQSSSALFGPFLKKDDVLQIWRAWNCSRVLAKSAYEGAETLSPKNIVQEVLPLLSDATIRKLRTSKGKSVTRILRTHMLSCGNSSSSRISKGYSEEDQKKYDELCDATEKLLEVPLGQKPSSGLTGSSGELLYPDYSEINQVEYVLENGLPFSTVKQVGGVKANSGQLDSNQ